MKLFFGSHRKKLCAFNVKQLIQKLLTTMLFTVSVKSAFGLEGGELQFARKTSPGSYRSCSVQSVGRDCGNSKKNENSLAVFNCSVYKYS